MSTLDNIDSRPQPEEVSPWPTGSRYGVLASLVLIALSLVMYISGMVDMTGQDTTSSILSNVATFGIVVAALVLAIKQHRDQELAGLISYGRAFYVGFIVLLVLSLIQSVYTYVFFAFIEPDLIGEMLEMTKERMMDQQGMSASDAENAMGMMSWTFTPGMFAVFGLLGTLFFGVIIDLIVAAIMKREA
ncbi:MAG TPA: DUF4199 domain-containing protein [Phaeodactylibacter sp.]|nr:DUF4199 domain-containing protein [Phaeodactylibacter sp.]